MAAHSNSKYTIATICANILNGTVAMLEREILITNKLGLHARASAKLVQLLSGFRSEAFLLRNGREVNAKSIMGVLLLAAGVGSMVTLRTQGEDEAAALDAAAALFTRNFDEGG